MKELEPVSKQLVAFIMACEMRSVKLARQASKDWIRRFFADCAPARKQSALIQIATFGHLHGIIL